MTAENDKILSILTVKIKNVKDKTIGTGTIYYSKNLKNRIYVITAAHCLFDDGDLFKKPTEEVILDFYNSNANTYTSINYTIDHNFVSASNDNDIAILVLDKNAVETITGTIPLIECIKDRSTITSFVIKGFPKATQGKELACINPVWIQNLPTVDQFQLTLKEDYNNWTTRGFSGSGAFLHANNHLYLYGVFARFRPQENGKVIYCQHIYTANKILRDNYLPTISFSFFGEHGLNKNFFKSHTESAIKNLGPRFNEILNFQLPIAQRFRDLAKDDIFRTKLLNYFDDWLSTQNKTINRNKHELLKEILEKAQLLHTEVIDWIKNISWSPACTIDLNSIQIKIDDFNKLVDEKLYVIYELQSQELRKDGDTKKIHAYHKPYEDEIYNLREFKNATSNLFDSLTNLNISLSNSPYLLIKGDAGSGKSHLLGDVAKNRDKNGSPTLLLLGQLFKNGQSVWQNILTQLDLTCSKDDLLFALNSIGQQKESRILILIDALNEGAGKELWYNELPGVINDLKKYPFIGFTASVRSTYWDSIIPESIQTDSTITIIEHQGFKGNEYAALKLFCEHYGLEQPHFPILTPEFTNPLFLQLICQGLQASNSKSFPQGLHGFSVIFEYYIKAISKKLSDKRDEYRLKPRLVKQAISEVAKATFANENRVLPLEEAVTLFEDKFANHRDLLNDLIYENVFTLNVYSDYKTQKSEDVVYFAYERFGDFFIAEMLLENYTNKKQLKAAFNKGQIFGELIEDKYWRNNGLLEIFSIILPEKFELEITEACDWIFKTKVPKDFFYINLKNRLNRLLFDSLKWRQVSSINDDKLTKWFRSNHFDLNQDDIYYRFIELTSIPKNPFNSDRLHFNLLKSKMAERDSRWLQHLYYHYGNDDAGNAFPIVRLIDWAWQNDISSKVDPEIARLTAQTLSWALASTHNELRDKTTKALVNLLEEKPLILITILEAFSSIDDLYIYERLFAVAYACALRTTSDASLKIIADYVFNVIFRNGDPPKHLLLRDYARNTVEYALHRKIKIDGDMNLIRPPYHTSMPDRMPTKSDIEKFCIHYNAPDYKERDGQTFNRIYYSVMSSNFGKYVIESALRNFDPVSFTFEKKYQEFLKKLTKPKRDLVKLYATINIWVNMSEPAKNKFIANFGKDQFDIDNKRFIALSQKFSLEIKNTLNKSEYDFFTNKVIPHLNNIEKTKDWHGKIFDSAEIQHWIVQRAFEFGYSVKLHGRYDTSVSHYSSARETKIERIGKKYQWIAFYEIMAMITDNHKVNDGYGNDRKSRHYQGPWELYLRDIDPVFTTKNPEEEEDAEIEFDRKKSVWWLDIDYNYWDQMPSEWVKTVKDLPEPKHLIKRTDEFSNEWVYLKLDIDIDAPRSIGQKKYESNSKRIMYSIRSYITHKKDATKMIELLGKKRYDQRWLSEYNSSGSGLFCRENYWSPIYRHRYNGRIIWDQLEGSNLKYIVTTSEAVGEISSDKSGAHFYYDMPCKKIFDGMNLRYSSKDGDFENELNETIVSNINPKGVLIRKKELFDFLHENNLEIIWIVQGEKQAYSGNHYSDKNHYSKFSGIYSFSETELKGSLKIFKD